MLMTRMGYVSPFGYSSDCVLPAARHAFAMLRNAIGVWKAIDNHCVALFEKPAYKRPKCSTAVVVSTGRMCVKSSLAPWQRAPCVAQLRDALRQVWRLEGGGD